jgi:predicted DNA-binding transcriptional regulator YafY
MDVNGRREELVGLVRRRSNATAPELARKLGISVRTVFRDLDAMRMRASPSTGPSDAVVAFKALLEQG